MRAIACHTRRSIAAYMFKPAVCLRKSCLAISDRSGRSAARSGWTRMAIDGGRSKISSQSASGRRQLIVRIDRISRDASRCRPPPGKSSNSVSNIAARSFRPRPICRRAERWPSCCRKRKISSLSRSDHSASTRLFRLRPVSPVGRTNLNLSSQAVHPAHCSSPTRKDKRMDVPFHDTELQVTIKGRGLYRLPVAHYGRSPNQQN